MEKLDRCIGKIHDATESIVPLYRYVAQMIFAPIDSDEVLGVALSWMTDAGRSAESKMTDVMFQQFIRIVEAENNPTLNKILYLSDVEAWLNALQDRLDSTIWMLEEFYAMFPIDSRTPEEQIAVAAFDNGEDGRRCYVAANTVFINLASVFDIIAKIACELECFAKYDFKTYPNIKSSNMLYKHNLAVSAMLKQPGMLFADPEQPIVRTVETLRNEYVHNGPWDRSPSIYYPADAEGNPLPAFMMMPDMTVTGKFVSVKNRSKFYSQGKKLNEELIPLVEETLEVIEKTIEGIKAEVIAQTAKGKDRKGTAEAMIAISSVTKQLDGILKKYANAGGKC